MSDNPTQVTGSEYGVAGADAEEVLYRVLQSDQVSSDVPGYALWLAGCARCVDYVLRCARVKGSADFHGFGTVRDGDAGYRAGRGRAGEVGRGLAASGF